MTSIVYLALKKVIYIRETIYSILSLAKLQQLNKDKCRIIIMSNYEKNLFRRVLYFENVEYIELPNEIINSWINTGYIFTVKIKALKYYFQIYHDKVLFIDSDTVFLSWNDSLYESISDKKFIMDLPNTMNYKNIVNNNMEYQLELDKISANSEKKFFCYMDNHGYLDSEKRYPLNPTMKPSNSGIIGMTYANCCLLDEVEELTQVIWEQHKYICAEEFAFSYIFSNNGEIDYGNKNVFHYYRYKFARVLVANCLEFFYGDDEIKYKKFLSFLDIDEKMVKDMTISDLPYFLFYLAQSMRYGFTAELSEDISEEAKLKKILKYRKIKIHKNLDEFYQFVSELFL